MGSLLASARGELSVSSVSMILRAVWLAAGLRTATGRALTVVCRAGVNWEGGEGGGGVD